MTDVRAQPEAWQFGRFRLQPNRRLLLADGAPVILSSRGYDILELLVRCHERVVARDEIVAHVWRGTIVSESNLTVQISNLRRALGEHADGEPLIVNLPGRGYQLVAEVTVPAPASSAAEVLVAVSAPAKKPAASPVSPKPARRIILASGGAAVLIAASLVLLLLAAPRAWRRGALESFAASSGVIADPRLTIAVERFIPIGNDQRTAALAARYDEAVLAVSSQFEELTLFPEAAGAKASFVPHFRLAGTVHVTGDDAVLTVTLTDTRTGRLVCRASRVVSPEASTTQQVAAAKDVLADLRTPLFQAEQSLRAGAPHDALDFFIEARVALGPSIQLSSLQQGLSLAEQAVRLDASYRPAKALLAFLLTTNMIATAPEGDDAQGERALTMVDDMLRAQPHNFLYFRLRAFILEELRRPDDAQATAELGLQIEPGDPVLTLTLGECLMLKADIAGAKRLMLLDASSLQYDTRASIAFAEGRYADAYALSREVVVATPGDYLIAFTMLLEVAALAQSNRLEEAQGLLRQATAILPTRLRSVHAQRQAVYVLPGAAWSRLKNGLVEAGMPF